MTLHADPTESAIARGAAGQDTLSAAARHAAYAGGRKKTEPLWDLVIRGRRVGAMLPMLERTLDAFGGARRRVRPDPPTGPHVDDTETREPQVVVR